MQLDQTMLEIAQTAARIVVEEGLDWGVAKQRAVRQMGLPSRTGLPDNDLLEEAVREYIGLFCEDTQPAQLLALRELALVWMERLEEFRPHLAGAVWRGTATRLSDIQLQLFCDDPKSAEIARLNQQVRYEPSTIQGFTGQPVEALSIHVFSRALNENIGVHLLVYDLDDLRGALKPDSRGRSYRGSTQALKKLLAESEGQLGERDHEQHR